MPGVCGALVCEFVCGLDVQCSVFRLQISLAALQAVLPLGFLWLDAGRFEPIPDGIRANAQLFRHLPHGAMPPSR